MKITTHNLLKSARKKSPVLQEDMAFLLGHEKGTGVIWKHEKGLLSPSIQGICKYILLHNVAFEDLFPKQLLDAQKELIQDIPLLQKNIRDFKVYNYSFDRIEALEQSRKRITALTFEDYRAHSISIFLNSMGFGYAVFKNQKELRDFGVERLRSFDAKKVYKHIRELIDFYQPKEIIVREDDARFKKLSKRVISMNKKIQKYALQVETPFNSITMTQVTKTFSCFGTTTKHQRAEKICEWFPECKYRQIRERTLTTFAGEHEPVFDAIAQGVTAHFTDNSSQSI